MRPSIPLVVLLGLLVSGYGPRSVTSGGKVVKWSLPVKVHLECDLEVRDKDVTALVDEGLSQWVELADSNVTFSQESLGVNVDTDNVCCFLFDSSACPSGPTNDGKNPIIIDDDGSIIAKFFGSGNRFTTLGFAAIINFETSSGEAVKGEAVFNAACLAGVELDGCKEAGLSFSESDFTSFIVHEIGHFLGLNHSQVNLDEASDDDTSNDSNITTMFPFFIQGNGSNFKTPERDDAIGLAVLYPTDEFSGKYFTVSGTVLDDNGQTEFACANLVARNTASSLARSDAISFVSGQLCPDGVFDTSCDGDYQIRGLDPNQSYKITAEPIDSDFRNSSGIPPCEGGGEQPTFTTQTTTPTFNNSAGSTTSGVNFTLANTSSNVNSGLTVGSLDISLTDRSDNRGVSEEILAIEAKTQSDDCPSSSETLVCGDSDSGGCSLLPIRR